MNTVNTPALYALIGEETAQPVAPEIAAVVDATRRRHGPAAAAVLVYGSCLREGVDGDKIIDLYLLVDSYRQAIASPLLRWANALLPPNVYYLETPFEERTIRAKYAVVSLRHFARLVSPATFHSYFWARFAQPVRIAWVRDETSRQLAIEALATAVETMLSEAAPLASTESQTMSSTGETLWVGAFRATYAAELRAERQDRPLLVYQANADRYDNIASALRPTLPRIDRATAIRRARWRWARRRALGKTLSVLRLIKAAFTFEGGARYIAWKISRHSGVAVTLTAWQERHPLLAAPALFWRLYRKGAFR